MSKKKKSSSPWLELLCTKKIQAQAGLIGGLHSDGMASVGKQNIGESCNSQHTIIKQLLTRALVLQSLSLYHSLYQSEKLLKQSSDLHARCLPRSVTKPQSRLAANTNYATAQHAGNHLPAIRSSNPGSPKTSERHGLGKQAAEHAVQKEVSPRNQSRRPEGAWWFVWGTRPLSTEAPTMYQLV